MKRGTSEAVLLPPVPAPVCSMCGGLGYVTENVPVGHPRFGKALPCVCKVTEKQSQEIQRLRNLGNLSALEHMTFESFQPDGLGLNPTRRANLRQAYEACWSYAARPVGWLILLGGYGCGKTHLAAAIANECIANGMPALFVVVPDLLDYLRAAYGPTSEASYDERLDRVQNAPLLILDDLGTQNATEWAGEKLYQILNYRYNARLPTVVTTNQALNDIDPRLHSRLVDPGLSHILTISAPDFRSSGAVNIEQTVSCLQMLSHLTFDTFSLREKELSAEQRDVLRSARDQAWAYAGEIVERKAGGANWLLLSGRSGCGKTHLAAAVANFCSEHGVPTIFTVAPDLLDYLRKMFAPQSLAPRDQPFDEVRRTTLLVLDDLGTESATPWAKEKLYQIINYRYNARLATVITTTLAPEALDPRMAWRVAGPAHCIHIALESIPGYLVQARREEPPATGKKRGGRRKVGTGG